MCCFSRWAERISMSRLSVWVKRPVALALVGGLVAGACGGTTKKASAPGVGQATLETTTTTAAPSGEPTATTAPAPSVSSTTVVTSASKATPTTKKASSTGVTASKAATKAPTAGVATVTNETTPLNAGAKPGGSLTLLKSS